MQEITVETSVGRTPPPIPPITPSSSMLAGAKPLENGESEWISNKVGKSKKVRLLVSGGDMGPKEIPFIPLTHVRRAKA